MWYFQNENNLLFGKWKADEIDTLKFAYFEYIYSEIASRFLFSIIKTIFSNEILFEEKDKVFDKIQ